MPATQEKIKQGFQPQIIYCQTPASNIYDLWAVPSDTAEKE